jgi:hypothetical protein
MYPIGILFCPDKLTGWVLAGFILFQRKLGAFAFRHPVLQDGCAEHTTGKAALSSEFPYRVFWGVLPKSRNRKNYADLILQLTP